MRTRAIFILRKDIGVGGWSKKMSIFSLLYVVKMSSRRWVGEWVDQKSLKTPLRSIKTDPYPVFQHNSTPSLIKHTTKCLVAFRTCTLVYTLHYFPISECNSLANQFCPKINFFFSSQSKQTQNLRSLNEIELKPSG